MSKFSFRRIVDDFFISSLQITPMMMFQNPICSGVRLLSVWTMGNHMFTSIFPSQEVIKYMVDDITPNTYKTVSFGGFKDLPMIKSVTSSKGL